MQVLWAEEPPAGSGLVWFLEIVQSLITASVRKDGPFCDLEA